MRQCWHSIGLSLTFSFIWRTLIITRKNITRVYCIWAVLAFYLLEVRVLMGLTDRRKTAKNLVDSRKN